MTRQMTFVVFAIVVTASLVFGQGTPISMDLVVSPTGSADEAVLEWFPSLEGDPATFEIRCYDENGGLVTALSVSGVARTATITDVSGLALATVEVLALSDTGGVLEISPVEPLTNGCQVHNCTTTAKASHGCHVHTSTLVHGCHDHTC